MKFLADFANNVFTVRISRVILTVVITDYLRWNFSIFYNVICLVSFCVSRHCSFEFVSRYEDSVANACFWLVQDWEAHVGQGEA